MIGTTKAALRRDANVDFAMPRRLAEFFWETKLLDARASGPLPTRALRGAALADAALVDIALVDNALTEITLLLDVAPDFALPACALLTFPATADALPARDLERVACVAFGGFTTFVDFATFATFVDLATERLWVAASASGTDSVNAISAVTRKEANRFKIFPNVTRRRKGLNLFRNHYDAEVYPENMRKIKYLRCLCKQIYKQAL